MKKKAVPVYPVIVATYSPCCHVLREGHCDPLTMHNGLCRDRNGGELGPTLYLTPAFQAPPDSAEHGRPHFSRS